MADNILRLKVESSEYDAKLKKAAEGIRHLAEVAHQSDGEITGLEKSELDFINALGEMSTKSKTAAGSLRELESVYKELKVVYDQLNDVEKADEGGRALAASLEQIKQRAQEARAQMDNASKSLQDNGNAGKESSSILSQLASKFTVNIDALKLFNAGLSVAKTALDVAKDAFMSSEDNVDEWGRTIEASKSLYEGFLTALNTGDISGYLSNIDSIVQAAREAYNELDRLGTMKTIQAPQMSAQQTENERLRMMIQTGRYIAPIDGRRATMQNGQLLTPEQIRRLEQQLQNGMKTVVTLVGNEVRQTGKAIDAVYNRQAKELGLSISEFRKGTSSMAEFDKRMQGYNQYQQWRAEHTTIDLQSGRETVARGNPFEQFAKWGVFRVDGDRYNDLVRLIQQRDRQAGQAYSMQQQAFRTMNRAEGFTVSKLMNGGTTGGTRGGTDTQRQELTELQENQKAINVLTQQYIDIMAAASKAGEPLTEEQQKQTEEIQNQIQELERRNALLKLYGEQAKGRYLVKGDDVFKNVSKNVGGVGIFDSAMDNIEVNGSLKLQLDEETMNAVNEQILKNIAQDGKAVEESWKRASSAIGTVSGAISQIEDPAAKIVGTIGQAIATIALAYAETLAKDKSSKSNIYAFIAAAAATTISLATTIASIHNSTGYAEGGIIKGNSFSGDMIPADSFVNAGELVLNRAQQGALASMIRDNDRNGGGSGVSYITGEQICVVIDRYLARTGRGELVTWK